MAPVYALVLDELVPSTWHHVERHKNIRVEADHGRLKHRLRPTRKLRRERTAFVIIAGLAFMRNPPYTYAVALGYAATGSMPQPIAAGHCVLSTSDGERRTLMTA